MAAKPNVLPMVEIGEELSPYLRPFDRRRVGQGAPISTFDGRGVIIDRFDTGGSYPIRGSIDGDHSTYYWNDQGQNHRGDKSKDLFLSPVGFIDGHPIFPGDDLINTKGKLVKVTSASTQGDLSNRRVPGQMPLPEVDTPKIRMSERALERLAASHSADVEISHETRKFLNDCFGHMLKNFPEDILSYYERRGLIK